MSLAIPKNKKTFWIILSLATLASALLAFRASAYYTIGNCPDCGNFVNVEVTAGGTGDLLNDTDFVASASFGYNATSSYDYQQIAERFIPIKDTRVCAVRTKIQTYQTNEQQVRLQVSKDSAIPAYSTNFVPDANAPIQNTNYNPFSYIEFVRESSEFVPTWVWFQFQNCWTAYAWHTYWFEFSLRDTGYQVAKMRGYQTDYWGGVMIDGFAKTIAGSWIDTGRSWSFEIVNDLSQAQQEMPPSSASYGFTDKDFGLLGNMFRDVIVWLFYPSQDALNQFGNLYDTIKAKPPIGYFTAVQSELGYLGAGSASITFDTTAAAGIINPLRVGLIVILWIMFAFWIFHRLRNLDL